MGFQKINIRDRYKKVVFILGVSFIQSNLNEPKKISNRLPSWDFFLKPFFYMKIQKTKSFSVPGKKNFFCYWTLKPPKRPNSLMVWIDQKNVFLNFCYLIRVEHRKWSEMCVLIVRFGLKFTKWDHI
jgi:hypothetical protein